VNAIRQEIIARRDKPAPGATCDLLGKARTCQRPAATPRDR